MHLKQHGMDLSDYKVSYGEPVLVKNRYHRCHLCSQIFLFTRSRFVVARVRFESFQISIIQASRSLIKT